MWSDNESAVDLLGFQHLSGLVSKIVRDERLLPATVGVFGDWGSGKSSLLEMVKAELDKDDKTIVVSFNGWQFEGFEDAKAALIGTILDELKDNRRLSDKAKQLAVGLLKRLDLLRLAGTFTKYALAYAAAGPAGIGLVTAADALSTAAQVGKNIGSSDVDDGMKFIKPTGEDVRQTVRKFRDDFGTLLKATDGVRLVVIIDDLDRCMPETIIESLEAIKLFLFVPQTAFIIGADERLVKYAVRKRFPELPGENSEVGRDYLEKLIQFAVRIPPLDRSEIETYINLLFAQLPGLLPGEFEKARLHVIDCDPASLLGVRFNLGVATHLFSKVPEELGERLALAERISPVLAAGLSGNPRQCKRFLNALMMRLQMAASRKITLQQRMLSKLMLLEYFKPEWFKRLAELQAASEGRPPALADLELSVRESPRPDSTKTRSTKSKQNADSAPKAEPNESKAARRPTTSSVVSQETLAWASDDWMRDWLEMEPALAETDLRPYFYFSRDILGSLGGAVRRLTPRAQEILNQLLQESEAVRELAFKDAKNLDAADAAAVFETLVVRVSHQQDLTEDDSAFDIVFGWVGVRRELIGQLITFLGRLPHLSLPLQTPAMLVTICKGTETVPAAKQLFSQWTDGANSRLAKAAQQQLPRLEG